MAPGTLDSKSRIAEQQVRQGLPKALVVDFIGSLVMALALAHVIHWGEAEPKNLVVGLFAAFLCWLGFVAFTSINIVTLRAQTCEAVPAQ